MVPDRNFSFPAWTEEEEGTEEEEVAEEEEVKEVGGEQNICLLGFSFLLTLFWNLQCSFLLTAFCLIKTRSGVALCSLEASGLRLYLGL